MRSVAMHLIVPTTKLQLHAEAAKIVTEISSIQTGAKYKGIALFGTSTTVGTGKNNTALP